MMANSQLLEAVLNEELLECLQDDNQCKYLYDIYTDQIKSVLERECSSDIDIPTEICQTISYLSNNSDYSN